MLIIFLTDKYIEEGKVKVNGETVTELGRKMFTDAYEKELTAR